MCSIIRLRCHNLVKQMLNSIQILINENKKSPLIVLESLRPQLESKFIGS